MGEAVHLHVPLLSIPIQGQYEQELNARYLQRLGYGRWADAVECDVIESFVNDAPTMQAALETYVPRDNAMLFACLDELLHDISLDEPARDALQTRAMGAYERPASGLSAKLRTVLDSDDDDSTDPGQLGRGPR